MDCLPNFVCFVVFNIIFGLSGLAIIGGGGFLFYKFGYNTLGLILCVIGVIIFLVFILGLNTKKNSKPLVLYLIFVIILLLFYTVLSVMLKVFPEKLIENIKKKIEDIDIENSITEYNMPLFIISTSGAACCLFAFITGICHYCKLKNRYKEIKKEDIQNIDCLQGLDYTNIDNTNSNNKSD